MIEEQEFSLTEAAQYLGITRQSMHSITTHNTIGRQVGKAWIFKRSELDAWLVKPRPKGGRPPKSERRPLATEAQPA